MRSQPTTFLPYRKPTPECLHSKKSAINPYVIMRCQHCGISYGPTIMDVVKLWLSIRTDISSP